MTIEIKDNAIAKLSMEYIERPVIRALLQVIPFWGTADTLLQHRAEEIRSERIRFFFDELAKGKHELTEELINSNDFLHCYFKTLRAALNTRQHEKIKMFARLLNNSANNEMFVDADEYEDFLDILDTVSFREFVLLEILRKYEVSTTSKREQLIKIRSYWSLFKSEVIDKLKIPEAEFNAYMSRLERTGLFQKLGGTIFGNDGNFGTTTQLFARLREFVSAS